MTAVKLIVIVRSIYGQVIFSHGNKRLAIG
jgi:hypothetical protein